MHFTTTITTASLLAFTCARPAPPVQAVPSFPSDEVANASGLNWIHVSMNTNPNPAHTKWGEGGYLRVPMNRLVYLYSGAGSDQGNNTFGAVSVKKINYADGSGKPVPGGVVECRVFVDAYGQFQYDEAFSDAGGGSYPYVLGDGNGVDIKTILCSDKGALAKLDQTTGNTNTTSPACTK